MKLTKPGDAYVAQVRSYAYLLWKQYGIRVVGVMLIFLPRDNPKDPEVWEERFEDHNFEAARLMLKQELYKHRLTMEAETLDDFKNLFRMKCASQYCAFCNKPFSELLNLGTKLLKTGKYPIRKKPQ